MLITYAIVIPMMKFIRAVSYHSRDHNTSLTFRRIQCANASVQEIDRMYAVDITAKNGGIVVGGVTIQCVK